MEEFDLPPEVEALVEAREALRARYARSGLRFTLDGNLVGDIGEAVAAELYDIDLQPRCGHSVDGFTRGPNRKSVQVKASGTFRGPAFRKLELGADHLLFFHLDFEKRRGLVVFNGPEELALSAMPSSWSNGQRMVSLRHLRQVQASLRPDQVLQRVR